MLFSTERYASSIDEYIWGLYTFLLSIYMIIYEGVVFFLCNY